MLRTRHISSTQLKAAREALADAIEGTATLAVPAPTPKTFSPEILQGQKYSLSLPLRTIRNTYIYLSAGMLPEQNYNRYLPCIRVRAGKPGVKHRQEMLRVVLSPKCKVFIIKTVCMMRTTRNISSTQLEAAREALADAIEGTATLAVPAPTPKTFSPEILQGQKYSLSLPLQTIRNTYIYFSAGMLPEQNYNRYLPCIRVRAGKPGVKHRQKCCVLFAALSARFLLLKQCV